MSDWTCDKCKRVWHHVTLPPVYHECNGMIRKGRATVSYQTCTHRGEPTGETVPCGCPSSPTQPVYWCELWATTCVRNPASRGQHRSCLQCFELGEGWQADA